MSWARIMAPLAGGAHDAEILKAAAALAAPFGAEVAAVHAPADIADLMPWMGEGFMGGVQITAMDSLKEAAAEGERAARAAAEGCGYAKVRFQSLETPVWAGLSAGDRCATWPEGRRRRGCRLGRRQGSQPRRAHRSAVAGKGRPGGDSGCAGGVLPEL